MVEHIFSSWLSSFQILRRMQFLQAGTHNYLIVPNYKYYGAIKGFDLSLQEKIYCIPLEECNYTYQVLYTQRMLVIFFTTSTVKNRSGCHEAGKKTSLIERHGLFVGETTIPPGLVDPTIHLP